MKLLHLSALAIICTLGSIQAAGAQSVEFYFRQDWCPDDAEVDRILDEFVLDRNGCCITVARPRFHRTGSHTDHLARWLGKLQDNPPSGACTGSAAAWSEEDIARVNTVRAERVQREAAARRAWDESQAAKERERAESLRAQLDSLLTDMPAFSRDGVCAALGVILRTKEPKAIAAAKKIAARRGVSVNGAMAERESIRIGVSECQMLASLGIPQSSNRSVGAWGVHVQHVYGGGLYVYIRNGVVTSWQD